MPYHLKCPKCTHPLYCRDCGEPIDAEASFPGAVGGRHQSVAFDPDRRNAWKTERGRILLVLRGLHPHTFPLAREIAEKLGSESPNQICTRLGELCAQGLVERTGRERLTSTGTPADEWKLTAEGLRLWRRYVPRNSL